MNKRLPENKKVFSLDIIKEYKKEFNPNYILMIVTAFLYIAILYRYGISDKIAENLDLIKYLILTPMMLSVVVIDYKLQIIPNRLNLTMFEIGLVFAFLYGMSNVAISINMLLGMLAGGGIFLLITLLGGLVYGKEAMGLGDVKLMGALGLYFGLTNIIIISLVSFLVCAIISIFLLTTKIKKTDEYIPFGPFIVIGAFVSIFVPYASLVGILMNIFTLGLYSKNN
jgi:leader peptidase (prepilin peptidase)/N-methyltransferase